MSQGEVALQMHVTAAYGNEGFAWFPGCYPIDYTFDPAQKYAMEGACGLIDIYGRKGEIYGYVKGVYDNGFSEEEIKNLPDNECIFRGNLPEFYRYKDESISVKSSNGTMVSTFEKDGKPRWYAVNLSTVYKNTVELRLPEGEYEIFRKNEKINTNEKITLTLDEGEGIYIRGTVKQ